MADLLQLTDITPGLSEKILELMPDAFKNDDAALEDFGAVSQARSFDPLQAYKADPATGIFETVLSGADPLASLAFIEKLDEKRGTRSRTTPLTHAQIAERFLTDPLALLRQLVELTRFVRDSNEASYATFIEEYSPALLAIEREKEARRLADYVLANAALGPAVHDSGPHAGQAPQP